MFSGKKTYLGSKDRYARLRKIETLNPETDYREITKLFYEDFHTVALLPGFTGFLMNNAAPRISRILAATGELEHRVAKRFLDTSIFAATILENGLDKGLGRDAARRVNSMHRRYDIHEDDFVIVACDQIVMGIAHIEKFGWRPLSDVEREGLRVFYTQEARVFGGRKRLPATLPEVRAFWERYMDEELGFEPQNQRMTDVMVDFVKTLFPWPMSVVIAPALLAQVDPRILCACGRKAPGPLARWFASIVLRQLGRLGPRADNAPDRRHALIKKVYPNGYTIDSIGTHAGPHGAPAPATAVEDAEEAIV